jgi:hypothetical protein
VTDGPLYGVCCGSLDKLQRFVLPHAQNRHVVALLNQTSIASAYNRIIEVARDDVYPYLILQHDDLEITDPRAEEKFEEVLEDPDVALIGVAGGRNVHGLDWWNCETVGHQVIDSGMLDFGPRSGDVQLLEGSILVFSQWALDNLFFDPLPGFHSYDEVAFKALDLGKRVVVADVDTHHHTSLGFKSAVSEEAWHRGNDWFQRKWIL